MKKTLLGLLALSVLCILLVLIINSIADAMTATVTGTNVSMAYDEPTLNSNDSTLRDLDHTTVYYDLGAGFVKSVEVPATAPAGGGAITVDVIVPVSAGQEVDVKLKATATDKSKNESNDSPLTTVRIDRLAPAPPK